MAIQYPHSPGSQVLTDCRDLKRSPNCRSNARVRAGREVFVNGGTEKQIASRITGQESGLRPGPAQSKFQRSREISGMQVCCVNGPASRMTLPETKPISDRTAGNIQELSKQVLVHVHRIKRVSPESELQSRCHVEPEIASRNTGVTPKLKIVSSVFRFCIRS